MKTAILVTTKETGLKRLYSTLSSFTKQKEVKLKQQTILNYMSRNDTKVFESDLYFIERLEVIR